jgi:sensor histidine kinase YesM
MMEPTLHYRRAGGEHWTHGTYWACQAGGWLLMAAVAVLTYARVAPERAGRLAAVYLCSALAGIALTHAWRSWLHRRGLFAAPRATSLLRAAPWIVAQGVFMTAVTALGFGVFLPSSMTGSWAWLPGAIVSWIGTMAVWSLLYVLVTSARRARALSAAALHHQAQAQQAELRALQAKVNPHFFFNSLNSLRGLVFEDQQAAARMIDQLAMLMRYSLGSSEQTTVPLAQELDAVRAYLAIEQIRFDERLRVEIDIDPALLALALPPMTLQTVVENAVKFGVESSVTACTVRIAGRRQDGAAVLTVANQGSISAASGSTRIGLENVRERLALAVAGDSAVTLEQRDGWVVAAIRIGSPACCAA